MKLQRICYLAVVGVLVFHSYSAQAQRGIVDKDAKTKPALMVVGSYHFANPGHDVVKSKVTDVSTPERQKQLLELIAKLEKYKPTKVVLECDIEDEAKHRDRFAKYLTGNYQLTINEREQLGFRLANDLADKKIYCVDTNTDSPGSPSDYNYLEFAAKDKDSDAFLNAHIKKLQEEGDKRDELFAKLSLTEQFIYLNQPLLAEDSHTSYFFLLRLGKGNEYVGANWFSSWYCRNLKILGNIITITDSPNDRILAIYGAGHLKLLNQLARESRFYNVEDPLKYLKW